MNYKDEVKNIGYEHEREVNTLKDNLLKELEGLADYNPNIKGMKLSELKDNYKNKLSNLQARKSERVLAIYNNQLRQLEQEPIKTLDDLSDKEMIYIQVILNSDNAAQVQELANRYKDNSDVYNMVRASISKLDGQSQSNIINEFNDKRREAEELENAISGVGYQNLMEENIFFKRLVI